MKTRIQNLFLVLACVGMLPMSAAAQAFTNLYTFTNSTTSNNYNYINSDGAIPNGGLVLLGNTLYGTTMYGGTNGTGTIFKINSDGTGFQDLYDFSPCNFEGTNIDGANPNGGLILSGNTLYGTTSAGGVAQAGIQAGVYGKGTVFKMNVSGGGFATLHYFSGNGIDGDTPQAGLVLQGNILYGTTEKGGTNSISGNGTVFKINTDGTGFATVHDFDPYDTDGYNLEAGLVLSGNTLYGTAAEGGDFGSGTLFKVNTDGTGFSVVHNFATTDDDGLGDLTNSEGAYPSGTLVISGNTLYGTAFYGGSWGVGTVFKVNTDSSAYAVLHDFAGSQNYDGADPGGGIYVTGPGEGLTLSGNTLYGTTSGFQSLAMVFAIYTNGLGYQIRYEFTGADPFNNNTNSDGTFPLGGLIISSNTLFGTASQGGYSGNGTIFSLSLNNLVVNGGFESFSDDWTFSGDTGFTETDDGSNTGITPHSGNEYMALWPANSTDFGYLSQTLDTIPGQNYSVSFWLYVYSDTYNSPLPDEFLVNWGGNTISDQTNLTSASWGYLQFNVTATAPTTALQFGFQTATYFGLDDVSVVLIPPTKPVLFPITYNNGQFSLMLNGITGTNYIVEMNTNISGNNWIPISTNTATGGTFNFTDTHATNASRYYRVVQQ